MPASSDIDRGDAPERPLPQWLLWLWWLALVLLWIALPIVDAILWVIFAPWEACRWLMKRLRRDAA